MDKVIEAINDKIRVLTDNKTQLDRYSNGVLDGLKIAVELIKNSKED